MRRRILLLVVGMTTLVIIAFAIPMALLIRSTAAQNARSSTLEQANSIAITLRNTPRITPAHLQQLVTQQYDKFGRPVSVRTPTGKVVAAGDLPRIPQPGNFAPRTGAAVPSGYPGGGGGADFDDRGNPQARLQGAPGGQIALAFTPPTQAGNYAVRVYLPDSDRYAGEGNKFLLLAGAALVLIVLGAVAGEILTRRITRPLVETANTAQQLSHGDTTARAPTDGPAEVADVGRALNRLADRIDQLIAEERETVADLSHRLRTPLTALRLDAEVLRDPADAERVGNHVSQLERTLTSVIHAARRPQREGRLPSCDAAEVVRERVGFWSALTDEQGRRSTVSLPADPLPVRSSAEDLAAAVDALLENVVAHTPEGTDFAVTLEPTATGARLTVSDEGPGLPEGPPVRGRSDRGSSGLGLDIARRSAEASGGSMTLGATAAGGASIILELAAP